MWIRSPFCVLLACAAGAIAQSTSATVADDPPITGGRRAEWAFQSTFGITALASTAIGAGWDTLLDHPREYSTQWDGFGKRAGMRASTTAARSIMEAGFSAIWDEDPRYHRAAGQPFQNRLANIFKMSVMARDSDGRPMPAYSRFIAIPASSFLSNTWRAPSDAGTSAAMARIGTGFLGRLAGNAWGEFWPDIRRRIFHKSH
jgi:hypothetical protein